MDWRRIEDDPPLNGTPVLLFCPGMNSWNRLSGMPDIVVGLWTPGWSGKWWSTPTGGVWLGDIGDVDAGYESTGAYFEHTPLSPTHWMPMPDPPTDEDGR